MNDVVKVLKAKNFLINELLIKNIDKSISLNDFLVFLAILNSSKEVFDCEEIAGILGLSSGEVMTSFNNLIIKELIDYKTVNENNKIREVISFERFYNKIAENLQTTSKKVVSSNIYETFQKELVRSLSPVEYEYINAWLDKGMSEDLIIGALKEAVLSGAKNFRYIDRILYDWRKQGFNSMNDVMAKRKSVSNVYQEEDNSNSDNDIEYFDYDWLNDDDE
ncbi:MAG: DnaD domain protein [bacterium]|nr:DnaD domain protein [bacterium]